MPFCQRPAARLSEYSNVKKPFSPSCENDILIVFRQFIDMIGPLSPECRNGFPACSPKRHTGTPPRCRGKQGYCLAIRENGRIATDKKPGRIPTLVALSRTTAVFSRDTLSGRQSFQTGLFCRENTGRKMSLSAGCRRFGQRNKRFHLSKPAIFARRTKLPAGMTPRLRRWIFRLPFRHHRFSCFKANPGRQADHYNGDGIRFFRRFPACSALIVKIR